MKKALVFVLGWCAAAMAADTGNVIVKIPVDALGFPLPVPVSVSGFPPEVDSVLRFDLFFMGFEFVAPDKARYLIQKNNAPGVGALIQDPLEKKAIYNKTFTGSNSTRQQTHALADDIAKTLTQKPGIAQTRIAFKARRTDYGDGEIYISDFDGFNAQPVTKDNTICAAPTFGGHDLLFYMSHKVSNKPDILSHNLASGARKVVARHPGMNSSPAISPDGRRLAMILSKSGSPNLYVSDLDGGNLKQLTTTKEGEASPCWSPDSRTICFSSRQSGKPALYTISAEGGKMSRVAVDAGSPTEPDWSPDGKYLVFTKPTAAGFEICVMPMQGTLRGTATVLVAGEDPVWAPNSRAVIFVKNVNHRHVLSLLDVPSKQSKELGRIPGDASQPSWAR